MSGNPASVPAASGGRTQDPNWPVRLREGVIVAPFNATQWQIRWDFDRVTILDGPGACELLPWLIPRCDGRTLATIIRGAQGKWTGEQIVQALDTLDQSGCLEQPTAPAPAGRAVVLGASPLAQAVHQSLTGQGCTSQQQHDLSAVPRDGLSVVCESDFAPAQLEAWERQRLARGASAMLVGAWDSRLIVGPIMVPGQTACYACYRRRLDSHRRQLAAYRGLEQWLQSTTAPKCASANPALLQLASAWTALEACAWLSGGLPRTVGRAIVYFPAEARLEIEPVLRVPWCRTCGQVASASALSSAAAGSDGSNMPCP